jgi:hypothetical protein
MATVIQFPNSKIKNTHPELSDDQRKDLLLREKIDTIENALEYVTMESIAMVHRLGFDITREDMVKDITIIVDGFRSLMYRSSGMEHPMQKFVEENYIMKGDEDGDESQTYAVCPMFTSDPLDSE